MVKRLLREIALALLVAAAAAGAAQGTDKTLRMALISAPPTLGNPFGGVGPPSSYVWNALFDTLTTPGDNGDLEPALALTWTPVEPTRWRLTLRPNVTFSNGEPFDANAVVTTLKWLRSDEGRRTNGGAEVFTIADVVAIDAMTVDIVTSRPDAILPKRLTAAAMVAPKAWTALGSEGFAQTPAGTGPFVLKTWKETGNQIVVEANRTSWRAPKIDRIRFLLTPDSVARVQSLLSGRLDVVNFLSPELAAQFEGTDFKTVISPTPQMYGIAFNANRAGGTPVSDTRVRRALNYAVDKVSMTQEMMRGTMRPASQGSTPVTFGYNPALVPYPHDPAKAKQLLAEAGHAKGLNLTAEVVLNGLPGDPAFLQLIQQDLREVGVELEIRATVFPDWLRKYNGGTFDTDLFGLSWNGAPFYDAIRAMAYHSCAKPNAFFCNAALTPLFDASDVEFDVEKRRAMLFDLAARMRDDPPTIYLFEVTDISVIAPHIKDFEMKLRVPVYEKLDITER
ncbi:MAG: ABC transporter substrate-binding protein [Rhodospirillaceae bacterium]|nr:ABC transporter substrate-binding protein [Rhodospirillaceae bacterium]